MLVRMMARILVVSRGFAPPKGGERPAALTPQRVSPSWQALRGIAPRCRSLVSRRNCRAGLVTFRQTFVRRCHGGWLRRPACLRRRTNTPRLFCNAGQNVGEGHQFVRADECADDLDQKNQSEEKEKGDPGALTPQPEADQKRDQPDSNGQCSNPIHAGSGIKTTPCSASAQLAPPKGGERPATLTPQRVSPNWRRAEELRRAAGRLLVAGIAVRDLLLCAKHLFVAAMLDDASEPPHFSRNGTPMDCAPWHPPPPASAPPRPHLDIGQFRLGHSSHCRKLRPPQATAASRFTWRVRGFRRFTLCRLAFQSGRSDDAMLAARS